MVLVVKATKVDHEDDRMEDGPLLRTSLNRGDSCPCGCSPDYFITLSDGEVLLSAELTKEQAGSVKCAGTSFLGD